MRMLVVDDDPLLIKSLRDTLEADGHLVSPPTAARKASHAFDSAAAGERLALVITDLGMPYVDGRKVASASQDYFAGHARHPAHRLGPAAGGGGRIPPHVDHVLNKPPKLRELREALALCQLAARKWSDPWRRKPE